VIRSGKLDQRPVLVALAGPNGAGKTTYFHAHLRSCGLRFVNADVIAAELTLDPYKAAAVAAAMRRELIRRKESFVFETVFSDPVGDKVGLLREAAASGYTVLLCFIGLANPELSEERVAMRVSKGGHDVPSHKLKSRYPRSLENLRKAIAELPHVQVYDNSDLSRPFRRIAEFEAGRLAYRARRLPGWFSELLS
jgi:predicted ABC-type ATPase